MATEIRAAREDELERVHFVVAYSFTADRTPKGREGMRHLEELAWPSVLLEDGEIVATLRVYDFTMLVNGDPIPMGGISTVACLPEYRRKGYVGMLLRHALETMRQAGQSVSGLFTPHPALYRKYGWMVAASNLKCSFNPKQVAPYRSRSGPRCARNRGRPAPRRAGLPPLQRAPDGTARPLRALVEGGILPSHL